MGDYKLGWLLHRNGVTILTWLVGAEEWGDYINLAGCCKGVGMTIDKAGCCKGVGVTIDKAGCCKGMG